MAPRPDSSPAASPAGAASVAARVPDVHDPAPDPTLAMIQLTWRVLFRRYVMALKRHGIPRSKADRLLQYMANQVNAIYGGTQ